jgi:hypothetical protein
MARDEESLASWNDTLVRHDDGAREFADDKGAESALERAASHGWTVVSMRDDWATVFAG